MRQAYKHVKREEKIAKKMKAAGRHAAVTFSPSTMKESDYSRSPVAGGLTPRSQNWPQKEGPTLSKGPSIWDAAPAQGDPKMYGQDDAGKIRPPFKFLDPKDDTFSH